MNSLGILFARFVVGAFVLAIAGVLLADPTSADVQDTIDEVAVDTDVGGNGPKAIGPIEVCRVSAVGNVFQIDIVADEVPPYDQPSNTGNVFGFGFDLIYDPTVLKITARDDGSSILFYQDPPLGLYFDAFSDSLPDTDGDYRQDAGEIGFPHTESGEGILARLSVEIVGVGVSALRLDDLITFDGTSDVYDANGNLYNINSEFDGEVRSDGSSCPDQDGDGLQDSADNCPNQANPSQTDSNDDGIGNVCDSVGGQVLITANSASSRGWPLAPVTVVGALLIALIGVGSYWRLRPR